MTEAKEKKSGASGVVDREPHDLGVPMLPGDASERPGPEDPLGPGPTRGDYRDRIEGNPHESVAIPEDEQVPGGPISRLEPQKPRAEEIGDVPGIKGGVETS
jgi:hypothetical protein